MFDRARRWIAERRSVVLGISPRIDPGGYFAAIAGGRTTASGVRINAAQALGITAFWRGVNLYARTIAALDLRVVREHDGGGFSPVRDDPRFDILRSRPNKTTPRVNFWEALIAHALTQKHGGFAEIEWSARGLQPLGLHLMDPRTTVPVVGADRSVAYEYKPGSRDTLPGSDVIHVRGLGWDGISGYDLVGLAAETLGVARAQVTYEGAMYGNGAMANGYFEVPGDPTPTQLGQMRAEINQVHGGAAMGGKFGFLTKGTKFVPSSYSPADAKMVEAQRAKVAEIANLLGVPPHMLGLMDGATVGNAEQQTLQFIKFSLLPWLRSIEGELDLKLFSPQERRKGLTVRHDTRELERGDMVARMTYWTSRFGMGTADPNQIRLSEGDEPYSWPQADDAYIGTNNLTALRLVDGKPTQPASNQTDGISLDSSIVQDKGQDDQPDRSDS